MHLLVLKPFTRVSYVDMLASAVLFAVIQCLQSVSSGPSMCYGPAEITCRLLVELGRAEFGIAYAASFPIIFNTRLHAGCKQSTKASELMTCFS